MARKSNVPQGIFRTALTVSYDNRYTVGLSGLGRESNLPMLPMPPSPLMLCMALFLYQILDFYAKAQWKQLSAEINVNNALNATYFTRRASGYPGPGILPSDPNVTFSLGWFFNLVTRPRLFKIR